MRIATNTEMNQWNSDKKFKAAISSESFNKQLLLFKINEKKCEILTKIHGPKDEGTFWGGRDIVYLHCIHLLDSSNCILREVHYILSKSLFSIVDL